MDDHFSDVLDVSGVYCRGAHEVPINDSDQGGLHGVQRVVGIRRDDPWRARPYLEPWTPYHTGPPLWRS